MCSAAEMIRLEFIIALKRPLARSTIASCNVTKAVQVGVQSTAQLLPTLAPSMGQDLELAFSRTTWERALGLGFLATLAR